MKRIPTDDTGLFTCDQDLLEKLVEDIPDDIAKTSFADYLIEALIEGGYLEGDN